MKLQLTFWLMALSIPLLKPTLLETQPATAALCRDPLNTALGQSAMLSETLAVTKEIISQTKKQSAPECTFLHSFLLNPVTLLHYHQFLSPSSSRSHLFSPLPDDKTTLLSSDKEMSPWRGVEGHTRSLSLLATLLKNYLSQTLTLNFPIVLPLSLTHSWWPGNTFKWFTKDLVDLES